MLVVFDLCGFLDISNIWLFFWEAYNLTSRWWCWSKFDVDYAKTLIPVVKWKTIQNMPIIISLKHVHSSIKCWRCFPTWWNYKNNLHVSIIWFKELTHPYHVCIWAYIVWSQTNPKVWYKWFVDYISSIGFFQSKYDNSLFFYKKNTQMTHLLYVDNIIITTSTDDLWKSLISLLSSEFSMKYLRPLSYILGIVVTQHTVGLFLF